MALSTVLDGFNRSVWHSLWVLIPVSGAVALVAFLSVKWNHYYFFDPKHSNPEAGDFGPHSQRYQDLAKLLITLSTGVIAFLINTMANEKYPVSPIISKIEWSAPIIVGFFGFSIASLIAFMVFQTVWYEEYSHSAKRNTYKAWKYATSNFLGWTGFIAFILGMGWLTRNIFKP